MGIRVAPLHGSAAKNSLLSQREHHGQVRDRLGLDGLDPMQCGRIEQQRVPCPRLHSPAAIAVAE